MTKNAQFLETVVTATQEKGKTTEQKKQENLKRISTDLQLLDQQLKRIKHDFSGAESCYMNDDPKENKEPSKQLQLQDGGKLYQFAECLLYSCEEQRAFCQGIYDVLIKLIAEFPQQSNDNFMCIKQLFDFTKQLKDQGKTFFGKIKQLGGLRQQLNEPQVAQEEELAKWSRKQEKQIEEVEKLLSNMLSQGQIEQKQVSSRVFTSPPLSIHHTTEKNGGCTFHRNTLQTLHSQ